MRKTLARHIQKHPDHTLRLFLLRTVSAQLHLFGLVVAVSTFAVLMYALVKSSHYGSLPHLCACLIFGFTGMAVFMSSALYHFAADGFRISDKASHWLNTVDHFAIYLFIAGTYTVFIVNAIRPPWDFRLLVIVWSCAISGMLYTMLKSRLPSFLQSRYLSTGLFVMLGWTLFLRISEAWAALNSSGKAYLTLGGLSYTLGAIVYASRRPDPFPNRFGYHEIWHIMVLLGFTFHSALVLGFYI